MHLISVDLPAPLSPTSAITSPAADLEVDVRQRLDGAERSSRGRELEERRGSVTGQWLHGRRVEAHAAPPPVRPAYLQYFLYSPEHTSLRLRNLSVNSRV